MFELVREVLYDKHPFYSFRQINDYRQNLKKSDKVIEVSDYGAGSHTLKNRKRKVSDIYRHSAIRKKYGEVLFRLVSRYKSRNIVELGTSLGVSTLYLSLPARSNTVYTIEGCPETAAIARDLFSRLELNRINSLVGRFYDVLPSVLKKVETIDFLFVDGHHERDATVDYFNMCKEKAGNDSIFVFDDIHWSKGMEDAWREICDAPEPTVTVDLYQLGLVFFRKECKKQHYVVM